MSQALGLLKSWKGNLGVTVMRAALLALFLMFGSPAGAEVVNLCDEKWWIGATKADLPAELAADTDLMEK
jgi:hypothetical protein